MRVNADPQRPSVPPVVWFAASMWAGCLAGEYAARQLPPAALVLGVAGGFMALFVAARRRNDIVVLVVAASLAGTVLSWLQWGLLATQLETVAACGARAWVGVVEADPLPGSYGPVVRVRVQGGPLDSAVVRVGWPTAVEIPDLGRQVRFSAVLKPLPLSEAWAVRAARAGACATGTAWKAEVGEWSTGWSGPLYAWRAERLARMHRQPGAGGDLAEGIVLGDRRRLLGTAAEQDFQVLGLTHLVAVSGSHLALACGAVAFIGALARIPRRPLVVITVLAGAVYAVVTGMPYSALRSLLMLGIGGAGQLLGRRGDGLASLAAAVIGVLALEPWASFDLGLQLSVLAVGSLLLFGGLASAWVGAAFRGGFRVVASPLALTLVAQAATIPLVASAFGMVSVLAPLANAVVGSLVSLALVFGLTGAVLGSVVPAAGDLGIQAAVCVLEATARLAEVMAALPGAAVAAGGGAILTLMTGLAAAGVWLRWPVPRTRGAGRRFVAAALGCSLALALGPAPPRQASVTVLDVGQGDAILVRDSGRVMLVDTGPDALTLRQALARTGVRRVDTLVLTHAHDDHTGGNDALGTVVSVGWVAVPDVPDEEGGEDPGAFRVPEIGAPVRPVRAGESWRLGDTEVSVLWPPGTTSGLSTNDTSVVLLLRRGPFAMVLTGDAEHDAQAGMAEDGGLCDIDVLKVPHHGSVNGLTAEALTRWSPEVAVISVGDGNDFGHPSSETLALLRGAGVRVMRTDECGDVTVDIGKRGYRLVASRRGGAEVVRARMGSGIRRFRLDAAPWPTTIVRGARGTQDRSPQACVPDLRRRRTVARPRPPPSERSHSRRGGPRLQLRSIRRRDRGRGGDRLGCQYAPLRVRAPTCRRALRGQDGCQRPRRPCRVRERPGAHRCRGPGRAQDAEGLEALPRG